MESEVTAEFLCPLPPDRKDAETGWPDHELLIRCGAEFLADPEAGRRIVKLDGDVFTVAEAPPAPHPPSFETMSACRRFSPSGARGDTSMR